MMNEHPKSGFGESEPAHRYARVFKVVGAALSGLLLMLNSNLVLAQAATTSPNPTAAASDSEELVEIIVTAQKREERLQDVPISIQVLSGKELDQQPIGGTLEALIQTPSISSSISDAGGMTQLSIRGVAPAIAFGDGSTTVGYYVDGVPFSLVRSAAVPNTDDYDLSSIEVLRGPQGTLYGATALNGVVNIISNDADPSHFDFKARVGGATTQGGGDSYRADAEVNIPIIQDKLAIRLVVGDEHDGGWINMPNINVKNGNTTDATSVRLKVDIRPIDNLKIDLTAWNSHDLEAEPSFGINGIQPDTYNPSPSTTDYNAYNGKVVYDLPFASLSSSTSDIRLNQLVYTDYDGEEAAANQTRTATMELISKLPASVLSEEFLINSRNSGAWRWQVGFFYRDAYDDVFQTLPALFGGTVADPLNDYFRDQSIQTAYFGQVTRTFDDDHFEVTAGLRDFHDSYGTHTFGGVNNPCSCNPNQFLDYDSRSATAHAVTPRYVFSWLPNPNTNIYATYSVGFRSGLEQNPLNGSAALAVVGPARPDTLHNYEIGAKGRLWNNLITYDASLYYIKWDDIQENAERQSCNANGCVPVGGTVNGTSASGPGVDLSLGYHPLRGLDLGFDFSENNLVNDANVYPSGVGVGPNNGAVYLKGQRTPYSPQYTGDAYVDYGWPLNKQLDAKASLSGNYRSQEIAIYSYLSNNAIHYSSCNNGNYCYTSGSPTLLNASFEIANHNNQTVRLYATNLTNWNGLVTPAYVENTAFRDRPRTFGIQFEVKH
jgi:iron complex outermembrane receptor protein